MDKHGHSKRGAQTRAYSIWKNMKTRCGNPRSKCWSVYGGRGIRVCKRWGRFENFLADMGEPPEGMTLDRKDNDGNYSKRNCRWATPREQSLNSRTITWLEHEGRKMSLSDWAREIGVTSSTMSLRVKRVGWPAALLSTRKYIKQSPHWG